MGRMKNRCTNKNNKDYEKYHARGISKEWLDFKAFFNDMGNHHQEITN